MSSSCDVSIVRGRVLRGAEAQSGRFSPRSVDAAFDRDLVGSRTEQMEAVEEAREAGRLAGYVMGRQEGTEIGRGIEREVHERARVRAHDAVSRICDAVARASATQLDAIEAMEATVIALALDIAEAVVGRELEIGAAALGRIASERALRLVPVATEAVLAIHPDDLALLGELDDLLEGRPVRVLGDPSVERGGAVVSFGPGSVRAVPSEALWRVREALSATSPLSRADRLLSEPEESS
jgi:flagellar assembly protein FliH